MSAADERAGGRTALKTKAPQYHHTHCSKLGVFAARTRSLNTRDLAASPEPLYNERRLHVRASIRWRLLEATANYPSKLKEKTSDGNERDGESALQKIAQFFPVRRSRAMWRCYVRKFHTYLVR